MNYAPRRLSFRKIICCGLSLVFLAAQGLAQDNPSQNPEESGITSTPPARTTAKLDKKAAEALNAAKTEGFPLATETVADNVSVEAVLLPPKVCSRVFGKEIAQNFAAVELTISNRSAQSGLILHSVFIDYTEWALSGSLYLPTAPHVAGTRQNAAKNDVSSKRTPTPSYQSSSQPNQIASVEYRVARGDLLDRQPWTTRNTVMRSLVLAGAIASAYAFSINEQGIVRGIAAFSGQVIPSAEQFWPDGTVGQMNRISDLGFQVNKVIPKNSSDIVVAFFPLDRFLTPGLKKLYLDSPALFFAPYALVLDQKAREALAPIVVSFMPPPKNSAGLSTKQLQKQYLKEADEFLTELSKRYMLDVVTKSDEEEEKSGNTTGTSESGVATGTNKSENATATNEATDAIGANKQIPCKDVKEPPAAGPPAYPLSYKETCVVTRFLAHASLNTVHVVIDGDMTINEDQVPASIVSINMDGGNDTPAVWTTLGDVKGVIHGSRLTGGVVTVAEAQKLGMGEIKTDDKTSTDKELHFTMPLTKTIPSGQSLTFKVTKKDKQNNSVESGNYVLPVQYSSSGIIGATLSGDKLTIDGSDFTSTKASPLSVLLFPNSTVKDPTITLTDPNVVVKNSGKVDVDLSAVKGDTFTPGCWTVKAKIGGNNVAGSSQFAKLPAPAVTCAGKKDKNIEVLGTGLLDLSGCGRKPPVFEFTLIDKKAPKAKPPVIKPKFESNTKVSFVNPSTSTDWQLEVQFNGAAIKTLDVTATSCPAN